MTVKIGDKTYDSVEEMFADMKRRDLEDVPFKALKPVKAYLRSKSLEGYNLWYWLSEPWKLVTELPGFHWRRAKWFVQRGKRGYADFDLWGLDGYLLSWLPDAIAELREIAHGFPTTMYDEDVDWSDPGQEASDAAFAKWLDILAEIENGLRSGVRYSDILDDMTEEEREVEREKFEAAWNLMGKHFFSLWD